MAKLFFVPIEPFEERYSSQWLSWFQTVLAKTDCFEHVIYIEPEPLVTHIANGEFLDVIGTNHYKASQLQLLLEAIAKGDLKEGDVVFFMDAWFPGLEMLAYARDGLKLDIKFVGCLHAGTWDPHDFLSQQGMGSWAEGIENSWIKILDLIFVATEFHKSLIRLNRNVKDPDKIKVTGFPIYEKEVAQLGWDAFDVEKTKRMRIVFPHRLAPEKCPKCFVALESLSNSKKLISNLKFVKTKDNYATYGKKGYYAMLDSSLIAVSFAQQETWGIAMQEAVLCGCLPVVPDRLSYSEMYLDDFKYSCDLAMPDTWQKKEAEVSNAYQKIYELISNSHRSLEKWKIQKHLIVSKGRMAIPLMLQHILQEFS